ncbi:uncharacterized protein LOC126101086 [Schistocerca cancellata]|uniref:uncharacterized protein LOC126101086 n=1 Tax=Schistocerca cancellata TaxID=274614 RepID=UPI0021186FDC|nr:uncharacterized protein LOC126101086 [Schistocerca cancellata]
MPQWVEDQRDINEAGRNSDCVRGTISAVHCAAGNGCGKPASLKRCPVRHAASVKVSLIAIREATADAVPGAAAAQHCPVHGSLKNKLPLFMQAGQPQPHFLHWTGTTASPPPPPFHPH